MDVGCLLRAAILLLVHAVHINTRPALMGLHKGRTRKQFFFVLHPVAQQLAVGFRVALANLPQAPCLPVICVPIIQIIQKCSIFSLWLVQNESVSPTEFPLMGKVYFQGFFLFLFLFAQNGHPAYHSATTLQGGGGLVTGNLVLRFLSMEVGGRLRTQHGILDSVGW